MIYKKTVFITGGTGTMGSETVKEFLKRNDRFEIRLLVLDNKSEHKKVAKYKNNPDVEIIFGNMKDRKVIETCVEGADFVLHIGALVSPMADEFPKECMKVNYGSTLNIINAIKKQNNSDEIGFAFIGTVGETGCRLPPIHWGRCGDPLKVSMFDYYSVSKVAAERAVIESGLKKWVCLRQTGMLPFNEKGKGDPIIFHQNLNNVFEWVTAQESGRLMANICEDWMFDSLWRNVYNIGGGEKWRFTFSEFIQRYFKAYGVNYKDILDPRDIALFNFHGQWFTDSDKLNDITNFRFLNPDEFFSMQKDIINSSAAVKFMKAFLNTTKVIKKVLNSGKYKERGTSWMIKNNKNEWIKAFFGTTQKKNNIKSWEDGYKLINPSNYPSFLAHGYDETKPVNELSIEDMKGAAEFRGGKCVSNKMINGNMYTPLKWKCHNGHIFEATPFLVLKAGHWCPICEKKSWNFAEIAKYNKFFAQVWNPLHSEEDEVYVKKEVNEDIVLNELCFKT